MADASIIRPPNHISKKVSKTGGVSPEEAILAALNAAGGVMGEYQGWAIDDLNDLWMKFQNLASTDVVSKSDVSEMFDIAHEIRGQGGSFGFGLISVIADSLCKFIEGKGDFKVFELDVIKVHIMAMKAVFAQKLEGPQKELTGQLSELLQALRNKVALKATIGQ